MAAREQEKFGIIGDLKEFASTKKLKDPKFQEALLNVSKDNLKKTIRNAESKDFQEFLAFLFEKENKDVSDYSSVDAGSASSSSHHNIPMSKSTFVQPIGGTASTKKPYITTYTVPGRRDTDRQSSANQTREQQSHDVDSLKKNFPSSDWQSILKDIQEHFEKLDKRCKQLQEESLKANSSKREESKQTQNQNKQPGAKETVKQSDVDLKPYLLKLTDHLKNRDKMVDFLEEENKAVCLRETTERARHMAEIETERNKSRQQSEDLKQKVKEADERANNNERFLNEKFQEFDEDKRKADAEVSQLLEEDKKKLDLIKKLQQDSRSLQAINGTLNEDIKKLEYKLQKTKDESVRKVEQMRDEFENERKSLHKKLQEMEKEKNEFRDRFSKIAGQKLVEKNADIADLSDPNRAMKLSERFGQIYDDDWTDAFQALTDRKMKPKEAITVLMDILKSCYKTCEEVAARQLEDLKLPLIQPVRFVDEVSKARAGVKEKPRISTKHEKMLKDARRQMWDASVGTVTQLMMAELKDWLKKDVGPKAFEDTKVYIEKCAETCWLSVLHDPPIYLKTDTKEGEKLDVNLYTAYSASGEKIDYLVWPPLFNGKEGGLLSKGVAEPLRTIKKDQKK